MCRVLSIVILQSLLVYHTTSEEACLEVLDCLFRHKGSKGAYSAEFRLEMHATHRVSVLADPICGRSCRETSMPAQEDRNVGYSQRSVVLVPAGDQRVFVVHFR